MTRERLARKIERAIEPYILSGRYRELAARRILDCLPRPRREKRVRAWGIVHHGNLNPDWIRSDRAQLDRAVKGEPYSIVVPVTITYPLPKGKKHG